MGSQRVRHDWATELNTLRTSQNPFFTFKSYILIALFFYDTCNRFALQFSYEEPTRWRIDNSTELRLQIAF